MLKILILIPLSFLILYTFQDGIIYTCGSVKQMYHPSVFGLPEIQYMNPTIFFEKLNANRTIYYFHGNGISAENTFWHVGRLYQICNCSIYIMDPIYCRKPKWVGYSQNTIINNFWKEVRYHIHLSHENIFMGVSLGTAHVLHIYWYLGIKKIILENPFTSIDDLVPLPSWCIQTKWNNLDVVGIPPSTLILTSEKDEIVPPEMSKRLLNENTKQVILSGANHGDAGAHPDYLPAIEAFLK